MLCPVDCAPCREALCRVEGCKLSGEAMLEACHFCGEILGAYTRVLVCVSCIDSSEEGGSAGRHAAGSRR